MVAVLCASRPCLRLCLKTCATASCSLEQPRKISGSRRRSRSHLMQRLRRGKIQLLQVCGCLQCVYIVGQALVQLCFCQENVLTNVYLNPTHPSDGKAVIGWWVNGCTLFLSVTMCGTLPLLSGLQHVIIWCNTFCVYCVVLCKIQTGFTFLLLAHLGSPGQRAVIRVCVYFFVYCVYGVDLNFFQPSFHACC